GRRRVRAGRGRRARGRGVEPPLDARAVLDARLLDEPATLREPLAALGRRLPRVERRRVREPVEHVPVVRPRGRADPARPEEPRVAVGEIDAGLDPPRAGGDVLGCDGPIDRYGPRTG